MRIHVLSVVPVAALLVFAAGGSRPAAAAAAAPAVFTTVASPGGGQIMRGSLGRQSSLRSAAVAMLSRIHQELGDRPTVVQVAQNPAVHAMAIFFTATRRGQRLSGMSVVAAAPGSDASGAAMYDTTARFPTTIRTMLQRLGALEKPAAGRGSAAAVATVRLAPAERLIVHQFSDGTGTIGIPADWTLKAAGGGSAVALGPAGTTVNFNSAQGALVPSSPMGQSLARGTGIFAVPAMRQNALSSLALLPYTGDPVQAWLASWPQMGKQRGTRSPSFVVKKTTRMGPNEAFISGTGTAGNPKTPVTYYAYVSVTPPNNPGQWGMSFSYVVVSTSQIARQAATANAVFASIRINTAVLNSNLKQMRDTFQKQFESEIANDQAQDAARQARTNTSIAQDNANQDAMQKQAVGMENFSLDRSVVSNGGTHATVSSNFASALVQSNPNYQIVPPSQLVKGVDY